MCEVHEVVKIISITSVELLIPFRFLYNSYYMISQPADTLAIGIVTWWRML